MRRYMNRIINIIGLLMLVALTIYLIIKWKDIPSVIPKHYDFSGNVDSFGKKSAILICPITAWLVYIFITVISFFPQLWNTGVKVTEQNREAVYGIVRNLLSLIKLFIVFTFSYMTVCQVEGYRLPWWFTPVEIVVIIGIIIVYMVKLYKVR